MMAGRRNHTAPNNGSIRSAVAIPLAFYSLRQYFAPKLLMRRPKIAGFTPVIKTCGAGKLRQYSHHKFGKIWRGKICPVLTILRRCWLKKGVYWLWGLILILQSQTTQMSLKWKRKREFPEIWICEEILEMYFIFWQRQNSQKFLRLGTWLDICQSSGLWSH